jgi:hypothetical protein
MNEHMMDEILAIRTTLNVETIIKKKRDPIFMTEIYFFIAFFFFSEASCVKESQALSAPNGCACNHLWAFFVLKESKKALDC